MTRGPRPEKAIDEALPVARARGYVIPCQRIRDSTCDFVICSAGVTTLVLMARTKRLHGPLADMEAQFAGSIAAFSMVPQNPDRTCEIWACNYYRSLRFFRLEGSRLLEIDREGRPMSGIAGTTGTGATTMTGRPGESLSPAGTGPV